MTLVFELIKKAEHTGGRKPIKERGINWEESYHDKSLSLKKKFDKQLGPGGYFRWGGHDSTTNSDYYVVVGPSIHKKQGKVFFSGIKKMPPLADQKTKTYSPYGEYFRTMKAALAYANDRWGVPTPKETPNYTKEQLTAVDIPQHVN